MGEPALGCYNKQVTIIGTISRDGLCPCGAPPQPGSAFCSTDCEPEMIADPDDPWGFLTRLAAAERSRMPDPTDPGTHPA